MQKCPAAVRKKHSNLTLFTLKRSVSVFYLLKVERAVGNCKNCQHFFAFSLADHTTFRHTPTGSTARLSLARLF
jgi:hypothetical protein